MVAEGERDLAKVERDQVKAELERLITEVDDLKASSRSNTESLVALEAKKGEFASRLHDEDKRTEKLRHHIDTWAQREANLPFTVVTKYVELAEFKSFVEWLSISTF